MSQIQLFNDTGHIRNQILPVWTMVWDLLYFDNTGWHLRTSTSDAINWYVAVIDSWTNTWTICVANGITTWKWGNAGWIVIYEDITNPAKVTAVTWGKRIWVVKWAVGWVSLQYEWDSFFIDCFDNNAWDANNGLSVSNWTTVFGQDLNEAWDPAKLLSTREVPMDWHNIELEASNGWRTILNGANGDFQVWWSQLKQMDSQQIINYVHTMLRLWGWALHMHHNNDVYKNPWDGDYAQIFWYNSDLDSFRTYSKISWTNRSYFSQDYASNKTYLSQVTFGWIPVVNSDLTDAMWINFSTWELVRIWKQDKIFAGLLNPWFYNPFDTSLPNNTNYFGFPWWNTVTTMWVLPSVPYAAPSWYAWWIEICCEFTQTHFLSNRFDKPHQINTRLLNNWIWTWPVIGWTTWLSYARFLSANSDTIYETTTITGCLPAATFWTTNTITADDTFWIQSGFSRIWSPDYWLFVRAHCYFVLIKG